MKAIIIDPSDDEHTTLIDDSVADPNLVVTFSDNESVGETDKFWPRTDIAHDRKRGSLPTPDWFMHLSSELLDKRRRLEFDHVYASAVYLFDHGTSITIARPLSMDDIKDHPSYWFLKEIEDFRRDNPYPPPKDPLYDEKRFEFAILAAKILDFAKQYGCGSSPSWTLAKDVPDVLQEMIDIIDKAPELDEIHAPSVITWGRITSSTWPTSNRTIPRSTSTICTAPISSL